MLDTCIKSDTLMSECGKSSHAEQFAICNCCNSTLNVTIFSYTEKINEVGKILFVCIELNNPTSGKRARTNHKCFVDQETSCLLEN